MNDAPLTGAMVIHSVALVLLVGGLLLLARELYARLSSYDVDHHLTEADNPAVGTALAGYLAGVLIALVGVISAPSLSESGEPSLLAWDVVETGLYGLMAILLLLTSGWLNDRLIMVRFDNRKEMVEDRNAGTGAVFAGTHIASGLVLAAAFGGRVDPALLPEDVSRMGLIGEEALVALAFFALCQLVLVAYGHLYQRITPYDVHDVIARDYEVDGVKYGGNLAAGLAFGGNLAAMGLVLWGGTHADFEGWGDHLTWFGIATALGLVLLPLWRLFVDHVMLGKADLAAEIHRDRNINAALIESVSLLGLAAVIALVL